MAYQGDDVRGLGGLGAFIYNDHLEAACLQPLVISCSSACCTDHLRQLHSQSWQQLLHF